MTRADVEAELNSRLGEMSSHVCGTDNFHIPLRKSLRKLGYTVANPITDVEMAQVVEANEEAFYDLSHYYSMELICGSNTAVDWTAGPRSEKESQLANRQKELLKALGKKLSDEHGLDVAAQKKARIKISSLRCR